MRVAQSKYCHSAGEELTAFLLPLTRITGTLRLGVHMGVIQKQRSEEREYRWSAEENGARRINLHALCLGAALEIVNLLDADGADHTYTARDFAAIIYKNVRANLTV